LQLGSGHELVEAESRSSHQRKHMGKVVVQNLKDSSHPQESPCVMVARTLPEDVVFQQICVVKHRVLSHKRLEDEVLTELGHSLALVGVRLLNKQQLILPVLLRPDLEAGGVEEMPDFVGEIVDDETQRASDVKLMSGPLHGRFEVL
jgi:hypothetical protein